MNDLKARMVRAMAESQAVDDEGRFDRLCDILDFSGENAMRTVLEAALDAALRVAADHGHAIPRTEDLTPPDRSKDEWRRIEDQPEYDDRPHRQFILVEGWADHGGARWRRAHWGIATIRRDDQPDCLMGYRREDVERVAEQGGMTGVEHVAYWMPAKCPPFPPDVRA